MNAALQGTGLVKRFGEQPLFEIAGISLEPGSRWALTGRNGCGKSTLMRVLAGLEPAQQGTVTLGDESVSVQDLPAAYPRAWRRRVAYVHQHPYVFSGTVAHNVAYGARALGLWSPERAETMRRLVDWAGLGALLHAPAKPLSGGEKQRLALVRALLLEPEVLLLDEPTSSLDGEAREKVLLLIDDMAREHRTLLVVTHDRDLLAAREWKRMKLTEGRLVERR
ncbi:MAG: energy-coupling factor transporter ATP-binding protein [Rhizobacter sp.]|nr:energy-coupling factor transporter ATP-binding protein [Rhizobacter sp.]